MRRTSLVLLFLAAALAVAPPATAELGIIDDVPGATLLLPYFEVEWANTQGITTLFSVNNASATAMVAHVTLWTDESIPTLDFDIYLTGFDVQTINLRDIFNGNLPRTADDGQDTQDTISPQGPISQDINFPGVTGPCGNPYPLVGALDAATLDHIRNAHTGRRSGIYGGCLGAFYGDNIARGYITVDTVNTCNLSFPADPGYFTALTTNQNILWGDYAYVNPGQNFAQGETLVHIEACLGSPTVGRAAAAAAADLCPFSLVTGDYTFYGRYVPTAGQDQREGLASVFAVRYVNGGGFDGGTDLLVWRDSKINVGIDVHACPGLFDWFPLSQAQIVAFDEQENVARLCTRTGNVSPPPRGVPTCFPLEAQRIHVHGDNLIADELNPPFNFGWLFLNLNFSLVGEFSDPFPGRAQAWVTVMMDAEGRFSIGYDAIQLNNVTTLAGAGVPTLPVN